jgi:hypothetical protein
VTYVDVCVQERVQAQCRPQEHTHAHAQSRHRSTCRSMRRPQDHVQEHSHGPQDTPPGIVHDSGSILARIRLIEDSAAPTRARIHSARPADVPPPPTPPPSAPSPHQHASFHLIVDPVITWRCCRLLFPRDQPISEPPIHFSSTQSLLQSNAWTARGLCTCTRSLS